MHANPLHAFRNIVSLRNRLEFFLDLSFSALVDESDETKMLKGMTIILLSSLNNKLKMGTIKSENMILFKFHQN